MSLDPIQIFNPRIINTGDMSGDIISDVVSTDEIEGFALQVAWTGSSPVGTLFVECTNDQDVMPWTNIVSAQTSVAANSGDFMVNQEFARYKYLRVRYHFTSGTGTLDAFINGKV